MIFFNLIYFFYRYLIAILFLLLAASFSPVFAQIDSRLIGEGWQEFTFEDKQENRFKRVGIGIIELETDSSVSIAYLPFEAANLNLRETPHLAFEWQHEGQIMDTDVSKKAGMTVYWRFIWPFPISRNLPLLKKNYCDRWWWLQRADALVGC